MPQGQNYKVGDKVEYHPIGGSNDNVSPSTGEITEVQQNGDERRFGIKNDNTGKTTVYMEKNIVKKL